MNDLDKLPLLKAGMKLLVDQLGENDRVAIVVYAAVRGAGPRPRPPALRRRRSSPPSRSFRRAARPNGGRGIQLAYDVAVRNFIKGGPTA